MKKETWKELTIGTINLDAGNSVKNLTGTWRSGKKPQFIQDKCIQCFFCWLYCPHSAILVEGDEVKGINYDYCTGCGICSVECPPKEKAIIMVKEEVKLAEGGAE
ncbi:MAG: ferredoxin [Candidatus Aminicenantes bacterium]|nr:ferredoxin [Candidatus Aminicenantes bacterium]